MEGTKHATMEKPEIQNKIGEFIENLPEKRINDESIKYIRYGGIPVGWFLRQYFLVGDIKYNKIENHGCYTCKDWL